MELLSNMEDKDKIIKQYQSGMTILEVSKLCKVSYITIWRWLNKWGIKTRPRPFTLKNYQPWNKGKKYPKNHPIRKKISNLTKAGICGMLGKRHSKETIEKIKKSNLGKIVSEERRIKNRISQINYLI